MLNKFIVKILNQLLSFLFDDIRPGDLSISVFGGTIELTNLMLRKSLLHFLSIPLDIIFGKVGRVRIKLPSWIKFLSDPIEVQIDRIIVIAASRPISEWDPNAENEVWNNLKSTILKQDAWLELFQSSSALSSIRDMIFRIVQNIRITVTDVEVRIEEETISPMRPFMIGYTIKEIVSKECSPSWEDVTAAGGVKSLPGLLFKRFDALEAGMHITPLPKTTDDSSTGRPVLFRDGQVAQRWAPWRQTRQSGFSCQDVLSDWNSLWERAYRERELYHYILPRTTASARLRLCVSPVHADEFKNDPKYAAALSAGGGLFDQFVMRPLGPIFAGISPNPAQNQNIKTLNNLQTLGETLNEEDNSTSPTDSKSSNRNLGEFGRKSLPLCSVWFVIEDSLSKMTRWQLLHGMKFLEYHILLYRLLTWGVSAEAALRTPNPQEVLAYRRACIRRLLGKPYSKKILESFQRAFNVHTCIRIRTEAARQVSWWKKQHQNNDVGFIQTILGQSLRKNGAICSKKNTEENTLNSSMINHPLFDDKFDSTSSESNKKMDVSIKNIWERSGGRMLNWWSRVGTSAGESSSSGDLSENIAGDLLKPETEVQSSYLSAFSAGPGQSEGRGEDHLLLLHHDSLDGAQQPVIMGSNHANKLNNSKRIGFGILDDNDDDDDDDELLGNVLSEDQLVSEVEKLLEGHRNEEKDKTFQRSPRIQASSDGTEFKSEKAESSSQSEKKSNFMDAFKSFIMPKASNDSSKTERKNLFFDGLSLPFLHQNDHSSASYSSAPTSSILSWIGDLARVEIDLSRCAFALVEDPEDQEESFWEPEKEDIANRQRQNILNNKRHKSSCRVRGVEGEKCILLDADRIGAWVSFTSDITFNLNAGAEGIRLTDFFSDSTQFRNVVDGVPVSIAEAANSISNITTINNNNNHNNNMRNHNGALTRIESLHRSTPNEKDLSVRIPIEQRQALIGSIVPCSTPTELRVALSKSSSLPFSCWIGLEFSGLHRLGSDGIAQMLSGGINDSDFNEDDDDAGGGIGGMDEEQKDGRFLQEPEARSNFDLLHKNSPLPPSHRSPGVLSPPPHSGGFSLPPPLPASSFDAASCPILTPTTPDIKLYIRTTGACRVIPCIPQLLSIVNYFIRHLTPTDLSSIISAASVSLEEPLRLGRELIFGLGRQFTMDLAVASDATCEVIVPVGPSRQITDAFLISWGAIHIDTVSRSNHSRRHVPPSALQTSALPPSSAFQYSSSTENSGVKTSMNESTTSTTTQDNMGISSSAAAYNDSAARLKPSDATISRNPGSRGVSFGLADMKERYRYPRKETSPYVKRFYGPGEKREDVVGVASSLVSLDLVSLRFSHPIAIYRVVLMSSSMNMHEAQKNALRIPQRFTLLHNQRVNLNHNMPRNNFSSYVENCSTHYNNNNNKTMKKYDSNVHNFTPSTNAHLVKSPTSDSHEINLLMENNAKHDQINSFNYNSNIPSMKKNITPIYHNEFIPPNNPMYFEYVHSPFGEENKNNMLPDVSPPCLSPSAHLTPLDPLPPHLTCLLPWVAEWADPHASPPVSLSPRQLPFLDSPQPYPIPSSSVGLIKKSATGNPFVLQSVDPHIASTVVARTIAHPPQHGKQYGHPASLSHFAGFMHDRQIILQPVWFEILICFSHSNDASTSSSTEVLLRNIHPSASSTARNNQSTPRTDGITIDVSDRDAKLLVEIADSLVYPIRKMFNNSLKTKSSSHHQHREYNENFPFSPPVPPSSEPFDVAGDAVAEAASNSQRNDLSLARDLFRLQLEGGDQVTNVLSPEGRHKALMTSRMIRELYGEFEHSFQNDNSLVSDSIFLNGIVHPLWDLLGGIRRLSLQRKLRGMARPLHNPWEFKTGSNHNIDFEKNINNKNSQDKTEESKWWWESKEEEEEADRWRRIALYAFGGYKHKTHHIRSSAHEKNHTSSVVAPTDLHNATSEGENVVDKGTTPFKNEININSSSSYLSPEKTFSGHQKHQELYAFMPAITSRMQLHSAMIQWLVLHPEDAPDGLFDKIKTLSSENGAEENLNERTDKEDLDSSNNRTVFNNADSFKGIDDDEDEELDLEDKIEMLKRLFCRKSYGSSQGLLWTSVIKFKVCLSSFSLRLWHQKVSAIPASFLDDLISVQLESCIPYSSKGLDSLLGNVPSIGLARPLNPVSVETKNKITKRNQVIPMNQNELERSPSLIDHAFDSSVVFNHSDIQTANSFDSDSNGNKSDNDDDNETVIGKKPNFKSTREDMRASQVEGLNISHLLALVDFNVNGISLDFKLQKECISIKCKCDSILVVDPSGQSPIEFTTLCRVSSPSALPGFSFSANVNLSSYRSDIAVGLPEISLCANWGMLARLIDECERFCEFAPPALRQKIINAYNEIYQIFAKETPASSSPEWDSPACFLLPPNVIDSSYQTDEKPCIKIRKRTEKLHLSFIFKLNSVSVIIPSVALTRQPPPFLLSIAEANNNAPQHGISHRSHRPVPSLSHQRSPTEHPVIGLSSFTGGHHHASRSIAGHKKVSSFSAFSNLGGGDDRGFSFVTPGSGYFKSSSALSDGSSTLHRALHIQFSVSLSIASSIARTVASATYPLSIPPPRLSVWQRMIRTLRCDSYRGRGPLVTHTNGSICVSALSIALVGIDIPSGRAIALLPITPAASRLCRFASLASTTPQTETNFFASTTTRCAVLPQCLSLPWSPPLLSRGSISIQFGIRSSFPILLMTSPSVNVGLPPLGTMTCDVSISPVRFVLHPLSTPDVLCSIICMMSFFKHAILTLQACLDIFKETEPSSSLNNSSVSDNDDIRKRFSNSVISYDEIKPEVQQIYSDPTLNGGGNIDTDATLNPVSQLFRSATMINENSEEVYQSILEAFKQGLGRYSTKTAFSGISQHAVQSSAVSPVLSPSHSRKIDIEENYETSSVLQKGGYGFDEELMKKLILYVMNSIATATAAVGFASLGLSATIRIPLMTLSVLDEKPTPMYNSSICLLIAQMENLVVSFRTQNQFERMSLQDNSCLVPTQFVIQRTSESNQPELKHSHSKRNRIKKGIVSSSKAELDGCVGDGQLKKKAFNSLNTSTTSYFAATHPSKINYYLLASRMHTTRLLSLAYRMAQMRGTDFAFLHSAALPSLHSFFHARRGMNLHSAVIPYSVDAFSIRNRLSGLGIKNDSNILRIPNNDFGCNNDEDLEYDFAGRETILPAIYAKRSDREELIRTSALMKNLSRKTSHNNENNIKNNKKSFNRQQSGGRKFFDAAKMFLLFSPNKSSSSKQTEGGSDHADAPVSSPNTQAAAISPPLYRPRRMTSLQAASPITNGSGMLQAATPSITFSPIGAEVRGGSPRLIESGSSNLKKLNMFSFHDSDINHSYDKDSSSSAFDISHRNVNSNSSRHSNSSFVDNHHLHLQTDSKGAALNPAKLSSRVSFMQPIEEGENDTATDLDVNATPKNTSFIITHAKTLRERSITRSLSKSHRCRSVPAILNRAPTNSISGNQPPSVNAGGGINALPISKLTSQLSIGSIFEVIIEASASIRLETRRPVSGVTDSILEPCQLNMIGYLPVDLEALTKSDKSAGTKPHVKPNIRFDLATAETYFGPGSLQSLVRLSHIFTVTVRDAIASRLTIADESLAAKCGDKRSNICADFCLSSVRTKSRKDLFQFLSALSIGLCPSVSQPIIDPVQSKYRKAADGINSNQSESMASNSSHPPDRTKSFSLGFDSAEIQNKHSISLLKNFNKRRFSQIHHPMQHQPSSSPAGMHSLSINGYVYGVRHLLDAPPQILPNASQHLMLANVISRCKVLPFDPLYGLLIAFESFPFLTAILKDSNPGHMPVDIQTTPAQGVMTAPYGSTRRASLIPDISFAGKMNAISYNLPSFNLHNSNSEWGAVGGTASPAQQQVGSHNVSWKLALPEASENTKSRAGPTLTNHLGVGLSFLLRPSTLQETPVDLSDFDEILPGESVDLVDFVSSLSNSNNNNNMNLNIGTGVGGLSSFNHHHTISSHMSTRSISRSMVSAPSVGGVGSRLALSARLQRTISEFHLFLLVSPLGGHGPKVLVGPIALSDSSSQLLKVTWPANRVDEKQSAVSMGKCFGFRKRITFPPPLKLLCSCSTKGQSTEIQISTTLHVRNNMNEPLYLFCPAVALNAPTASAQHVNTHTPASALHRRSVTLVDMQVISEAGDVETGHEAAYNLHESMSPPGCLRQALIPMPVGSEPVSVPIDFLFQRDAANPIPIRAPNNPSENIYVIRGCMLSVLLAGKYGSSAIPPPVMLASDIQTIAQPLLSLSAFKAFLYSSQFSELPVSTASSICFAPLTSSFNESSIFSSFDRPSHFFSSEIAHNYTSPPLHSADIQRFVDALPSPEPANQQRVTEIEGHTSANSGNDRYSGGSVIEHEEGRTSTSPSPSNKARVSVAGASYLPPQRMMLPLGISTCLPFDLEEVLSLQEDLASESLSISVSALVSESSAKMSASTSSCILKWKAILPSHEELQSRNETNGSQFVICTRSEFEDSRHIKFSHHLTTGDGILDHPNRTSDRNLRLFLLLSLEPPLQICNKLYVPVLVSFKLPSNLAASTIINQDLNSSNINIINNNNNVNNFQTQLASMHPATTLGHAVLNHANNPNTTFEAILETGTSISVPLMPTSVSVSICHPLPPGPPLTTLPTRPVNLYFSAASPHNAPAATVTKVDKASIVGIQSVSLQSKVGFKFDWPKAPDAPHPAQDPPVSDSFLVLNAPRLLSTTARVLTLSVPLWIVNRQEVKLFVNSSTTTYPSFVLPPHSRRALPHSLGLVLSIVSNAEGNLPLRRLSDPRGYRAAPGRVYLPRSRTSPVARWLTVRTVDLREPYLNTRAIEVFNNFYVCNMHSVLSVSVKEGGVSSAASLFLDPRGSSSFHPQNDNYSEIKNTLKFIPSMAKSRKSHMIDTSFHPGPTVSFLTHVGVSAASPSVSEGFATSLHAQRAWTDPVSLYKMFDRGPQILRVPSALHADGTVEGWHFSSLSASLAKSVSWFIKYSPGAPPPFFVVNTTTLPIAVSQNSPNDVDPVWVHPETASPFALINPFLPSYNGTGIVIHFPTCKTAPLTLDHIFCGTSAPPLPHERVTDPRFVDLSTHSIGLRTDDSTWAITCHVPCGANGSSMAIHIDCKSIIRAPSFTYAPRSNSASSSKTKSPSPASSPGPNNHEGGICRVISISFVSTLRSEVGHSLATPIFQRDSRQFVPHPLGLFLASGMKNKQLDTFAKKGGSILLHGGDAERMIVSLKNGQVSHLSPTARAVLPILLSTITWPQPSHSLPPELKTRPVSFLQKSGRAFYSFFFESSSSSRVHEQQLLSRPLPTLEGTRHWIVADEIATESGSHHYFDQLSDLNREFLQDEFVVKNANSWMRSSDFFFLNEEGIDDESDIENRSIIDFHRNTLSTVQTVTHARISLFTYLTNMFPFLLIFGSPIRPPHSYDVHFDFSSTRSHSVSLSSSSGLHITSPRISSHSNTNNFQASKEVSTPPLVSPGKNNTGRNSIHNKTVNYFDCHQIQQQHHHQFTQRQILTNQEKYAAIPANSLSALHVTAANLESIWIGFRCSLRIGFASMSILEPSGSQILMANARNSVISLFHTQSSMASLSNGLDQQNSRGLTLDSVSPSVTGGEDSFNPASPFQQPSLISFMTLTATFSSFGVDSCISDASSSSIVSRLSQSSNIVAGISSHLPFNSILGIPVNDEDIDDSNISMNDNFVSSDHSSTSSLFSISPPERSYRRSHAPMAPMAYVRLSVRSSSIISSLFKGIMAIDTLHADVAPLDIHLDQTVIHAAFAAILAFLSDHSETTLQFSIRVFAMKTKLSRLYEGSFPGVTSATPPLNLPSHTAVTSPSILPSIGHDFQPPPIEFQSSAPLISSQKTPIPKDVQVAPPHNISPPAVAALSNSNYIHYQNTADNIHPPASVDAPKIPIYQTLKWTLYIREFRVSEIVARIALRSAQSTPVLPEPNSLIASLISLFFLRAPYPEVTNFVIKFPALTLRDTHTSIIKFVKLLLFKHYNPVLKIFRAAGSLDLTGNLGGLASFVTFGMERLILEPFEGITVGPHRFIIGFVRGILILALAFFSGSIESFTLMTGSIARITCRLTSHSSITGTLPDAIRPNVEDSIKFNPDSLVEGLRSGGFLFVSFLWIGLCSIWTLPIFMFRQYGAGFIPFVFTIPKLFFCSISCFVTAILFLTHKPFSGIRSNWLSVPQRFISLANGRRSANSLSGSSSDELYDIKMALATNRLALSVEKSFQPHIKLLFQPQTISMLCPPTNSRLLASLVSHPNPSVLLVASTMSSAVSSLQALMGKAAASLQQLPSGFKLPKLIQTLGFVAVSTRMAIILPPGAPVGFSLCIPKSRLISVSLRKLTVPTSVSTSTLAELLGNVEAAKAAIKLLPAIVEGHLSTKESKNSPVANSLCSLWVVVVAMSQNPTERTFNHQSIKTPNSKNGLASGDKSYNETISAKHSDLIDLELRPSRQNAELWKVETGLFTVQQVKHETMAAPLVRSPSNVNYNNLYSKNNNNVVSKSPHTSQNGNNVLNTNTNRSFQGSSLLNSELPPTLTLQVPPTELIAPSHFASSLIGNAVLSSKNGRGGKGGDFGLFAEYSVALGTCEAAVEAFQTLSSWMVGDR